MPARGRTRAKLRLSIAECEEISLGLGGEESHLAIGRRLGRAPSTISREVNENSTRLRYRAVRADEAAYKKADRPKVAKLRRCRRLRATVEAMLNKLWSQQQVSARLRLENPDDSELRVSHEMIYQSLIVQTSGALRKVLPRISSDPEIHYTTRCVRRFRTSSKALGHQFGGAERVRTADLCVANAALSQLSYGPTYLVIGSCCCVDFAGNRGRLLTGWPVEPRCHHLVFSRGCATSFEEARR